MESGEKQQGSPATLTKLATALGVSASELLTIAGYTSNEAEALPAIRTYLRSKYGHLSTSAQDELAEFLERLEAEESTKRAEGRRSK